MDDDPWTPMISGIELRYLLTMTLVDCRRSMTVAELTAVLRRDGFAVRRRTSKTISDALRWEVRKGRVVRVGRASYAPGRLPRSTEWWIRERVLKIRAQIVAPTLAEPAWSCLWCSSKLVAPRVARVPPPTSD